VKPIWRTDTHGGRVSRKRSAAVVGLLGLLVAGIALLFVLQRPDLTAEQVQKYQDKLFPLVQEWGRIEIQGMRPAIADLDTPGEGVPPETIAVEAEAWRDGLREIRAKIARVPAPSKLQRANMLFDQAISQYIQAAEVFAAAARANGTVRSIGVENGVKVASEGARIYNEASIVLQQARTQVGLPRTPDFPSEPAGSRNVSG
jgi:hypothetical protein